MDGSRNQEFRYKQASGMEVAKCKNTFQYVPSEDVGQGGTLQLWFVLVYALCDVHFLNIQRGQ